MRRLQPRSAVLMEFGRILRETREDARISQSELMRRLGKKGHTRVSQWERGMQDPGIEDLILLAAALGVGPEDLLPNHALSTDSPASEAPSGRA